MDLATMLQKVRDPNHAVRTQAEAMMQQAADSTPGPFMAALAKELNNQAQDVPSRQQAGLYLKNLLHAEDDAILATKVARWLAVDEASRGDVRSTLLQCLLSPESVVRHTAAQAIGSVAAIDLPRKMWVGPQGLVSMILQCVTSAGVAETAKEAALEACGYVCEELEVGALDPQQTNEVLTAIVDGIKAGRPEPTRLAAVKALMNSLAFCAENFGREVERNMLMTVVCEATTSTEPKVRSAAFECVGRVAELYYEHLEQGYMDALYPMTVNAITSDQEVVAMMAVEFWSTVCETEMELEEGSSYGYMAKAFPHLMPTLLATLEKQNEDVEDEEWNLAAAAASCVGLIANTVEDQVVDHVLPYVSGNAVSPEWRKREAAIMAFGQILEGPQNESAMATVVQQALPLLVQSLVDPHVMVKDTAAWTLGRVAEFHPAALNDAAQLMPLLTNLMVALDDASPKVAASTCGVVHHVAENREAMAGGAPWFGPQIVGPLLHKLLAVTDREDWEEHNLRFAAFEAVNMIVETHQPDCRALVLELTSWVFGKLQQCLNTQCISDDDREQVNQHSGLLVALLHYIVMGCEAEQVATIADASMQYLLQVMQVKSSVAAEEAIMAMGKLIDKLEGRFERYLEAAMPLLIEGLKNSAEAQVCAAAVGCVGDLCRAVEGLILPKCDEIAGCLLQALENPALKRDVKPPMLGLFGDMALAIGGNFQRYTAPPSRTMIMLYQASKTVVDPENLDMVDYLNELHEGILEAYTGIVNGLSDGGVAAELFRVEVGPGVNAVQGMAEFFAKLAGALASPDAVSDEVLRSAVGLIGDVARNLGKPSAPLLPPALVAPLLDRCAALKDEDSGEPDMRAQEMCGFARSQLAIAHQP